MLFIKKSFKALVFHNMKTIELNFVLMMFVFHHIELKVSVIFIFIFYFKNLDMCFQER